MSAPEKARAVRAHAFGANDQLVFEEVAVSAPGEGEVLVRVAAAGVNPVDWKILRGYLAGAIPTKLPFVPGWELAGTVVQRGHAARRFSVGDRVYGYIRRPAVEHGAYAEYVTVPECYLATAASKLSLEESAGIPLAGLTAFQCLHDAVGLRAGETVLIVGASGGVGGFAVQLAKAAGARVVAVASEANRAHCVGLGADDFVPYDQGALERSLAAHHDTVDVIVDCSGGETFAKTRAALKAGGRAVSITTRAAPAGFEGVAYHYVFVEPNSAQLAHLAQLADEGRLTVHLHAKLPLASAAEALALSEGGHTRGKVVLTAG
jgi:NADPH:quinone reductase-like Zn-dependent oxidoreductase